MKKPFTPPRLVAESSLTEITRFFLQVSRGDNCEDCEL